MILKVSTKLGWQDVLGAIRVRLSIGRMSYTVEPGLYAVGNPNNESPVLVSANYKLSFDFLRKELGGLDVWILVLDTKGVNVWCAAGKGTFGTEELVGRIRSVNLDNIVFHRRIILPQLSAPGVAAHIVKKESGFSVVYGPVRAEDIKAFMQAGMKASPEMRLVRFDLVDRMAVIPVELVQWFKWTLLLALVVLGLSGIGSGGYDCSLVFARGMLAALMVMVAYLAGGIVTPILLPWLPGRAFSLKGLWVGLILWALLGFIPAFRMSARLDQAGILLIVCSVTSFMAMNYTGTSTFTSQSGVKKEMRIFIPLQIAALVAGVCLWIVAGILM
jgi:acetyl-CoA decarbonylase/synthase complex subunit gamma